MTERTLVQQVAVSKIRCHLFFASLPEKNRAFSIARRNTRKLLRALGSQEESMFWYTKIRLMYPEFFHMVIVFWNQHRFLLQKQRHEKIGKENSLRIWVHGGEKKRLIKEVPTTIIFSFSLFLSLLPPHQTWVRPSSSGETEERKSSLSYGDGQ